MVRKFAFLLSPLLIAGLVIGCGGDDNDNGTPVPTITAPAPTQTPAAPANTPAATATAPATAPANPTATPPPPTDGTVFPQNPGDTAPFEIKSDPDPITGVALLTDVRVGAHPEQGGWDRIVFEFDDERPAGLIEYVDSVQQCGSGNPMTLPGEAILFVRFEATNAHTEAGQSSIDERQIQGPGNSILASEITCDFEALVEWAIGVSGEQNFKVALLQNPTRVVIDVKW